MRRLLLILALCLLPVSCWGASLLGSGIVASGGGTTYLVDQNFEGTGYDNSESWTESGSVDEDYTTTVLRGSNSCYVSGADSSANHIITDTSEIWLHILVRFTALPTGDPATIIRLKGNEQSTEVARVYIRTDGTAELKHGSSISYGTTVYAINTTYHFWLHWKKSTGSDGEAELYIGTTTTRPTTAECTRTAGTGTYDVDNLALHAYAGMTNIFDQVLVDDAEFTTVAN